MDTIVATDNHTATGTLRYNGTLAFSPTSLTNMPSKNATPVTTKFMDSLKSLNSKEYPANVPTRIDHSLVFAIGVGVNPCATCVNASRVVADINNVSFVMPTTPLLEAHYYNISGVYTQDFPAKPPMPYNYTGTPPTNMQTNNGTKVYTLEYNSTVQIVLQGTAIIAPESHPTHLHGFNFFVVGKGIGNYDSENDPVTFNLVDPVERNTISVPTAGWTAIRFRADNPGTFYTFFQFIVGRFFSLPSSSKYHFIPPQNFWYINLHANIVPKFLVYEIFTNTVVKFGMVPKKLCILFCTENSVYRNLYWVLV